MSFWGHGQDDDPPGDADTPGARFAVGQPVRMLPYKGEVGIVRAVTSDDARAGTRAPWGQRSTMTARADPPFYWVERDGQGYSVHLDDCELEPVEESAE